MVNVIKTIQNWKQFFDFYSIHIDRVVSGFKVKWKKSVWRLVKPSKPWRGLVGGSQLHAHYNPLGLRLLLKPWKFEDRLKPRRALPNKKLMAYYPNPENRLEMVFREGKHVAIQWNPDIIGPEESALIRKVSFFLGLIEKYTNTVLGESVLFREVSLFLGLRSTQTWCLGKVPV